MVSSGSQGEVVTSRSKTVVVTIEVWKELLQDMMLVVLDSVEQTFVGIFSEFSSSAVTNDVGLQAEPNTSMDELFNALFVSSGSEPTPRGRAVEQLGQHCCSFFLWSPYGIGQTHYIFILWFLSSFLFFFYFFFFFLA